MGAKVTEVAEVTFDLRKPLQTPANLCNIWNICNMP